ncbi:MAG: type IV pilus biogenesis protein PilM [Planctomycetota bacterium]
MTRTAGLEITHNALRLAIFSGSAKKYTLVDYREEPLEGETPEERQAAISTVLGEIVAHKENQRMEFVTCLDARQAIIREISVPFTRDEQIAKTVRFEAENYLHAYAIEDVVVEYLKCSSTEESSRLLICAAPKTKLKAHLAELTAQQIDPAVVELDATALASAFASTPLYTGEQTVLLIDVGEDSTRFVMLEKNRIVKVRAIWNRADSDPASTRGAGAAGIAVDGESPNGANESPNGQIWPGSAESLKQDLASRFDAIERSLEELDRGEDELKDEDVPFVLLTDDEYNTLRGVGGAGGASAADAQGAATTSSTTSEVANSGARSGKSAAAKTAKRGAAAKGGAAAVEMSTATSLALAEHRELSPVDRLVVEIERTFASYLMTGALDLIVVSGPLAGALQLAPRLSEHFEVDATFLDLGGGFPITWDGDVAELNRTGAVACGLGLRGLGHGLTSFDFRKEEFRFERRFQRLMPSLTVAGLLLCGFLLIWGVRQFHQYRSYQEENRVLLAQQAEIYRKFFEIEPNLQNTKSPDYFLAAERKLKEMSGEKSSSSRIKQYENPMKILMDFMTGVKKAADVYPIHQSININSQLESKSTFVFFVPTEEDYQKVDKAIQAQCKLPDCKLADAVGSINLDSKTNTYRVTYECRLKAVKAG